MSKKFHKDRSVKWQYFRVPMYYTFVRHPRNKQKELVLIDDFGKNFVACWYNNKTGKMGITFLVKSLGNKFIYKDKEYPLGSRVF